jgi:hypothetical protein
LAQCSYLKWANASPKAQEYVGKATVLVSHAWKYPFLDLAASLAAYAEEHPNTFFWIDALCNNQHATPTLDLDWLTNAYKKKVQSMAKVLLVTTPWEDPLLLKSAW